MTRILDVFTRQGSSGFWLDPLAYPAKGISSLLAELGIQPTGNAESRTISCQQRWCHPGVPGQGISAGRRQPSAIGVSVGGRGANDVPSFVFASPGRHRWGWPRLTAKQIGVPSCGYR